MEKKKRGNEGMRKIRKEERDTRTGRAGAYRDQKKKKKKDAQPSERASRAVAQLRDHQACRSVGLSVCLSAGQHHLHAARALFLLFLLSLPPTRITSAPTLPFQQTNNNCKDWLSSGHPPYFLNLSHLMVLGKLVHGHKQAH